MRRHDDRGNCVGAHIPQCGIPCECTIFRHSPVDELHSFENKRHAGATFLLTPAPGGVKPQSFSDVSGSSTPAASFSRARAMEQPAKPGPRAKRLRCAHGAKQLAARDVAGAGEERKRQRQDGIPRRRAVDPACCESGNPLSSETIREYSAGELNRGAAVTHRRSDSHQDDLGISFFEKSRSGAAPSHPQRALSFTHILPA
jgi:hypothetical protein